MISMLFFTLKITFFRHDWVSKWVNAAQKETEKPKAKTKTSTSSSQFKKMTKEELLEAERFEKELLDEITTMIDSINRDVSPPPPPPKYLRKRARFAKPKEEIVEKEEEKWVEFKKFKLDVTKWPNL